MTWLLMLACTSPDEGAPAGDPDVGWDVLRYGDFVAGGVPAELWFDLVDGGDGNVLDRTGRAADLPRGYNLFTAGNGVELVGGITCLGCHAAEVDGVFYPGVGDPRIDFAGDAAAILEILDLAVRSRYGEDSPEFEAYFPFGRGSQAVTAASVTPFAGVNPAFSLERAAVANRDPTTLEWVDTPVFDVPEINVWSDTPPWWHLNKRETLYWTGFGRGDTRRLLMQISVVALTDVTQAQAIVEDFDDVLAWIEALEPPAYPGEIDADLARDGEVLFEQFCARCHGTYGDDAFYDELVVPLDGVDTDPTYAQAFTDTPFIDWLNDSWFDSGADESSPIAGYVAPPLDGIWVTAPYLHNGSVPDLASLLNPEERPALWRRDPTDTQLDHERMGWPYTVPAEPDVWTYDTTAVGASHEGHTYGADLSDAEHDALVEYLKTL